MSKFGPSLPAAGLAAALAVLVTAGSSVAAPAVSSTTPTVEPAAAGQVLLAQADDTEYRELQPRYEPVQPEPEGSYNDEYIFGLTRGVAGSTMHPAAKILVFPLTVPLDLVLLPFEALGGFF